MDFYNDVELFLLRNIPRRLSAADLRRIFSQFVEAAAFRSFHFRRRPDMSSIEDSTSIEANSLLHLLSKRSIRNSNTCCLLLIKKDFCVRFSSSLLEMWQSDELSGLYPCCKLMSVTNMTKIEKFRKLIEFRPPYWMPQGNVGSTTMHFFNLIRTCQLGCDIIGRLQLKFQKSQRTRKYGSVPFTYDISSESLNYFCDSVSNDETADNEKTIVCLDAKKCDSHPTLVYSNPVSTDELPEEWDRFETLHDDPYNVDRTANKSLKYESKIELKWEKGGPGLVHYMDEFAWRQFDSVRKDEFFDEPASFDWDINTQVYEGSVLPLHGCDLDTRQIMDMQGVNSEKSNNPTSVHGLAFSRRLMNKYGWKPGSRLGRSNRHGLLNPVSTDGSLPPRTRTGIGYHGTKRLCNDGSTSSSTRLSKKEGAYIRSIFDTDHIIASRSGSGVVCNTFVRPDPELVVKYRSDWKLHTPLQLNTQHLDSIHKKIICTPFSNVGHEGINFQSGGVFYHT